MKYQSALLLLSQAHIHSVVRCDDTVADLLGLAVRDLPGCAWGQLFPQLELEEEAGTQVIHIGGRAFYVMHYPLPDGRCLLELVLAEEEGAEIFRFALDLIDIGVQIYGRDQRMLFLNSSSEAMSSVQRDDVLGKRVLEVYDTNEQDSTVLQAYKTKSSIYHKYDAFAVRPGVYYGSPGTGPEGDTTANVVNTSVPKLDADGEVAAVVNLEYDAVTMEKLSNTVQDIRRVVRVRDQRRESGQDRYYRFEDIVTEDPAFRKAISLARKNAAKGGSVFIAGETGTGKELVAQSIYTEAEDRYKSFVAVNCSTIPETLADTILFGAVKGAYTGSANTEGLFAEADGGVLFLDEVNSLSLSTQARLLRVLQEGVYRKIGSNKETVCNVRILSSCNLDPWRLMEAGALRRDLFYRLTSCIVEIPPLRERRGDIRLLAQYFLRDYCRKLAKNIFYIEQELEERLARYGWPGNVRELKNVMEHAVNLSEAQSIGIKHIPRYLRNQFAAAGRMPGPREAAPPALEAGLGHAVDSYERDLIVHALEVCQRNITKTADRLHISRQALQYKLRKHGLQG